MHMNKKVLRLLSLLVVLCLFLTACGEKVSRDDDDDDEGGGRRPSAHKEKQAELSEQDMEALTQQVQYAALASVFHREEFRYGVDNVYDPFQQAHVGDIDGDGAQEMVYGNLGMVFDLSDGYNATFKWEQSGNNYYLDKDGRLYARAGIGDAYDDIDAWYSFYEYWYTTWDGNQWAEEFVYGEDEVFSYDPDTYEISDEPIERSFFAYIGGRDLTEEEFDEYMQQLALEEITTTCSDFTQLRLESKYRDSAAQGLQDYFSGCTNFRGQIQGDFDGDGLDEFLFVLDDPFALWRPKLMDTPYPEQFYYEMDLYAARTAIITFDPSQEDVCIRAHCTGSFAFSDSGTVHMEDGMLIMDGTTLVPPCGFTQLGDLSDYTSENLYQFLTLQLQQLGYDCYTCKLADVGDTPGDELLYICRKDGQWCLLTFVVVDGQLLPAGQISLEDNALYLVQHEGKLHYLRYYQHVSKTYGGQYRTEYNYYLNRYDSEGLYQFVDYVSVSYLDNEKDATVVAEFFQGFTRYLVDTVVIYDPYFLLGQQWLEQGDASFGTVPETQLPDTAGDEQLGFVHIQDPSSFLNLREGPGTDYPTVRMDPNDYNSYIRQALGSPVTILETVETGDEENPVWAKVRIMYQGQEFIGYSSMKYIRLYEE
jgi:hypothetical protein